MSRAVSDGAAAALDGDGTATLAAVDVSTHLDASAGADGIHGTAPCNTPDVSGPAIPSQRGSLSGGSFSPHRPTPFMVPMIGSVGTDWLGPPYPARAFIPAAGQPMDLLITWLRLPFVGPFFTTGGLGRPHFHERRTAFQIVQSRRHRQGLRVQVVLLRLGAPLPLAVVPLLPLFTGHFWDAVFVFVLPRTSPSLVQLIVTGVRPLRLRLPLPSFGPTYLAVH